MIHLSWFLRLIGLAFTASLFLLMALPVQAQVVTPPALENSSYDADTFRIADQLQCPVCQGVTVAYSNSGLAQQMRTLIKKKLEQGESRDQILQYFVDRYGEGILTNPPKSGFTLLVWLLPLVGFLLGAGLVGYILRGWRNRLHRAKTVIEPVDLGTDDIVRTTKNNLEVPVSTEVLQEYEARVEQELSELQTSGVSRRKGREKGQL